MTEGNNKEEVKIEDAGVLVDEAPMDTPEQGMKEEKTGLIGTDGEEVKKISIPVVKYKDFVFPITTVTPEFQNYIGPKGEVAPISIIKELRLSIDEMRNKFTLLSIGLAVMSKTNPELKVYLETIGLVLADLNQKQFFPFEETTEK